MLHQKIYYNFRTTNRAKENGNMQLLNFHMFDISLLPGVFQNILWVQKESFKIYSGCTRSLSKYTLGTSRHNLTSSWHHLTPFQHHPTPSWHHATPSWHHPPPSWHHSSHFWHYDTYLKYIQHLPDSIQHLPDTIRLSLHLWALSGPLKFTLALPRWISEAPLDVYNSYLIILCHSP